MSILESVFISGLREVLVLRLFIDRALSDLSLSMKYLRAVGFNLFLEHAVPIFFDG